MDASEKKVHDHIARFGWHAQIVTESKEGPAFAYSIGLYRTWQHPEILICGLGYDTMHQILSNIAREIKQGTRFADGDESAEILEGYCVAFRQVQLPHYRDYFGFALWYYQGPHFPVLQCVWPDRYARFPWDDEYPESVRWRQPELWQEQR